MLLPRVSHTLRPILVLRRSGEAPRWVIRDIRFVLVLRMSGEAPRLVIREIRLGGGRQAPSNAPWNSSLNALWVKAGWCVHLTDDEVVRFFIDRPLDPSLKDSRIVSVTSQIVAEVGTSIHVWEWRKCFGVSPQGLVF